MRDVSAYVGFEPYQQSCFNANNYSTEFDNQDLNIVHNKKKDLLRSNHKTYSKGGDVRY